MEFSGEVDGVDLLGIHHVTAMSARIQENYRFYTQVLGLRLVKRSVNQDDVRAYHLFYSGHRLGYPGNDLTFFDWDIPPERRGTRSITRTYLRVPSREAVAWWADWLADHGVLHQGIEEVDGRAVIYFEDPEGQRLAIIDQGDLAYSHEPWERSPVPAAYQIRGQGPVELSVPRLGPTDHILTQLMNLRQVRSYRHPHSPRHTVYVYEMGPGGANAELHVVEQPDLSPVYPGAGGVHHVALRTPTYEEYEEWVRRVRRARVPNSGPVDRFWFRSLYFREPGGILFEIATDEPGFVVDEDPETLGEKLVLPPFLEPRREEIEAHLKPLTTD